MPDVYIAKGHGIRPDGSFDPGATDGGHTEQRDSQPVAEACTARLRAAGLEVMSEADQPGDPNFYGTTAAANKAGVKCVVSFHYDWNQAPPGAFMIATSDEGRRLGWAIEKQVAAAGFAIRDYPDDRDGLYLLDKTTMPAVIFECGRIGHSAIDEPSEQRRMGEAAALGILDWLGIPWEDEMTPEQEKALNTLVAIFNSKSTDEPPWGSNHWERYLPEVWGSPGGDPGPINLVTHIQLAKVYVVLRQVIARVAPPNVNIDEIVDEIIQRLED